MIESTVKDLLQIGARSFTSRLLLGLYHWRYEALAVAAMIRSKGYEPVWKDFDQSLVHAETA